jgi:hypothetical protein
MAKRQIPVRAQAPPAKVPKVDEGLFKYDSKTNRRLTAEEIKELESQGYPIKKFPILIKTTTKADSPHVGKENLFLDEKWVCHLDNIEKFQSWKMTTEKKESKADQLQADVKQMLNYQVTLYEEIMEIKKMLEGESQQENK